MVGEEELKEIPVPAFEPQLNMIDVSKTPTHFQKVLLLQVCHFDSKAEEQKSRLHLKMFVCLLILWMPQESTRLVQDILIMIIVFKNAKPQKKKGNVGACCCLIGISLDGEAVAGVVYQPFIEQNGRGSQFGISSILFFLQLLIYRFCFVLLKVACCGACLELVLLVIYFFQILGRILMSVLPQRKGDTINPKNDGKFTVTITKSHPTTEMEDILKRLQPDDIIKTGGAAWKMLLVLEGKADVYFHIESGTKKWDT